MQVAYEGNGLSAYQTCSEISSTITKDWAETAFNIILYSMPILGEVVKSGEIGNRVCNGLSALIKESKSNVNSRYTTKAQVKIEARKITRNRQACDVEYILGKVIAAIFFTNVVVTSAAVFLSVLAPSIVICVLMILHSQVQYKNTLEIIDKHSYWR